MPRPGRWQQFWSRTGLAILALGGVLAGIAAAANAFAPAIVWQPVSTLPADIPPVQALVLDRLANVLYAQTDNSVFLSRDGGRHWQAIIGLTDQVTALAVDENGAVAYAATGNGVLRSMDGGETWNPAGTALADQPVSTLTVEPQAGVVYAGTAAKSVYSLARGAAQWTLAGQLPDTPRSLLAGRSRGEVFAATDSGVWHSLNGGQSWTRLGPDTGGARSLTSDSERGLVFAIMGDSRGFSRFAIQPQPHELVDASPFSADVRSLALDDQTGDLYAGGANGLFRSSDDGGTWQMLTAKVSQVNALALDLRQKTLYAGTPNGVYVSRDTGATWQAANIGLVKPTAVEALQLTHGTVYARLPQGELFGSADKGEHWEKISDLVAGGYPFSVDRLVDAWYTGDTAGLFRLGEAGDNWQIPQTDFLRAASLLSPTVDETTGVVYDLSAYQGIYASPDGNGPFRYLDWPEKTISAIMFDTGPWQVYVGTPAGNIYQLEHTASWKLVAASPLKIQALAVDAPTNTLYVGTSQGVFRGTGDKTQWVRAGLIGRPVIALALDRGTGRLYAGTDAGAFTTGDGGESWQAISTGLVNSREAVLAQDAKRALIYAGTQAGLSQSADGGASWESPWPQAPALPISALVYDAGREALYGIGNDRLQRFTASGNAAMGRDDWYLMWGLAVDHRRQTIYVGTGGEVLRSPDGGATWESLGYLTDADLDLQVDEVNGDVYVVANGGLKVYRLAAGDQSWTSFPITAWGVPLNYAWTWNEWGSMGRLPGRVVWTTANLSALRTLPAAWGETNRCLLRPLSNTGTELLCAIGPQLERAELETMPLPWLALRLWVWQALHWLAAHAATAGMGFALSAALTLVWALAWAYRKFTRPFGVLPWAVWLAPGRLERYARPAALEAAWPDWEKAVRAELATYGDVLAVDLQTIPAPFRRLALRRYAELYVPVERLEAQAGRLRLQDRNWVQRWQAARRPTRRDHQPLEEAAADAADTEARVLAEALGSSLGEAHNLGGARVYQTETLPWLPGPATCLLLVWFTDAWIGIDAVKSLVGLLNKEPEGLVLIVPPDGDHNSDELRQVLRRLTSLQNFRILSRADVLALLIAREPHQRLTQWLGR